MEQKKKEEGALRPDEGPTVLVQIMYKLRTTYTVFIMCEVCFPYVKSTLIMSLGGEGVTL